MWATEKLRNTSLACLAGILLSANVFADDLPDAPSATKMSQLDPVASQMGQTICDSLKSKDCKVTADEDDSPDTTPTSHFYIGVMMSWEHAFGSSEWQKKIFYNGAYRVSG